MANAPISLIQVTKAVLFYAKAIFLNMAIVCQRASSPSKDTLRLPGVKRSFRLCDRRCGLLMVDGIAPVPSRRRADAAALGSSPSRNSPAPSSPDDI